MTREHKMKETLWRADIYRLLAVGFDAPSEKNVNILSGIATDLITIQKEDPGSRLLHSLLKILEGRTGVERFPRAHARGNLSSEQSEREGEAPAALPLVGATRAHIREETLMHEYQRLFMTHVACPPSEGSYHLTERGAILGDIAAFYEAFRVKFRSESGPPDAIKMELAFMHTLALKKMYALEKHLDAEYEITEDAEKTFLEDHLGRWVSLFVERLLGNTSLHFYQALAHLLEHWIREECHRFRITPAALPVTLSPPDEEMCCHCSVP